MWQMENCSVDKDLIGLHPESSTTLCASEEQQPVVSRALGGDQSDLTAL